jgi:putative membrane protein
VTQSPETASQRRRQGGSRGWVGRLQVQGIDPDPRFTFANERTFLAWIRTSLALLAGGVGLEAFVGKGAFIPGLRTAVSAGLLILGAALAITAFVRWARSERALREGRSLPGLGIAPVLAGAVAVSGLLLLIGSLAHR